MIAVRFLLAALLGAVLGTSSARADAPPEKAALCAACHGEKGVPIDKSIPVLWGQNEGYIYIQLRDFARGARQNEQMAAIVAQLSRDDMKALAAYFSTLPWPNLLQKSAPDDVVRRAETVAASAQCPQCHQGGYIGASVQPRLADQCETYLLATMRAFRSGARANNDWMTALLKTYSDDDLKALASYLGGL